MNTHKSLSLILIASLTFATNALGQPQKDTKDTHGDKLVTTPIAPIGTDAQPKIIINKNGADGNLGSRDADGSNLDPDGNRLVTTPIDPVGTDTKAIHGNGADGKLGSRDADGNLGSRDADDSNLDPDGNRLVTTPIDPVGTNATVINSNDADGYLDSNRDADSSDLDADGDNDSGDAGELLDLVAEDGKLHVEGGMAFDRVAIFVGLQRTHIALPGGAVLGLVPLGVVAMGTFDNTGEFHYEVPVAGADSDDDYLPVKPFSFLVQALSIRGDSEDFVASKVLQISYNSKTGQISPDK
jgi:hypothetical protein